MASNQKLASFPVGAAALRKGDVVKLTAGLLVITTAKTDRPIGVMMHSYDANAPLGLVCQKGPCRVLAGDAAIVKGEELMPHDATDGVCDTHDAVSTSTILGVADESSSQTLQLIMVDLGASLGTGPAA